MVIAEKLNILSLASIQAQLKSSSRAKTPKSSQGAPTPQPEIINMMATRGAVIVKYIVSIVVHAVLTHSPHVDADIWLDLLC